MQCQESLQLVRNKGKVALCALLSVLYILLNGGEGRAKSVLRLLQWRCE